MWATFFNLNSTVCWSGDYRVLWSNPSILQGNYVALNEEEIEALDHDDYERKLKRSYEILANAGAHYVIDSIVDLPPVIEDVNRRLAAGEKP